MNDSPSPSPVPPSSDAPRPHRADWRHRLHTIIFEADTPAGKAFDVVLLVAIVLSVIVVVLETVPELEAWRTRFFVIEWVFTILFTVEYVLRLICVLRPMRYALSFYGVVDLLSILPTYLSLLIPGAQELLVVRALRILRVFRVFKLGRYLKEASTLRKALIASRAKVVVFLTTILVIVVIMGAAMHLIEGDRGAHFRSIPEGIYWSIVTITTVGFGDVVPTTALGKMFAAVMMILGWALIIVPTGILSAELVEQNKVTKPMSTQHCPHCAREGHEVDATYCKYCGGHL